MQKSCSTAYSHHVNTGCHMSVRVFRGIHAMSGMMAVRGYEASQTLLRTIAVHTYRPECPPRRFLRRIKPLPGRSEGAMPPGFYLSAERSARSVSAKVENVAATLEVSTMTYAWNGHITAQAKWSANSHRLVRNFKQRHRSRIFTQSALRLTLEWELVSGVQSILQG